MTEARTSEIWLGFAGVGAVATLVIGTLGQYAARQWGVGGAGSVWAGCFASLLGSLAGAVPLSQEIASLRRQPASGRPGGAPIAAIGKASLFRLAIGLIAALAALGTGFWERRTLLFALAASYVALLGAETWWMLNRLSAGRD